MVDDLLCIGECGPKSVQQNSYINYKISSKKLQFGSEKCKKLCIGKSHTEITCPDLIIDGWKEICVKQIETGEVTKKDIFEGEDIIQIEDSEKYLGDIVNTTGNQRATVKDRKSPGSYKRSTIRKMEGKKWPAHA